MSPGLHGLRFLLLCNKCPQTEGLATIIISLSLVILWVDWAQLCGLSAPCDVSGGLTWLDIWDGFITWLAVGPGFAGAVDQRDSVLFYVASPGDLGFSQHGIWVPRESIPKGRSKSCKSLKALLRRCRVSSLLTNPVGQSESQGQPKFCVVRLLLTRHHLWGLIIKNIKQVCFLQ